MVVIEEHGMNNDFGQCSMSNENNYDTGQCSMSNENNYDTDQCSMTQDIRISDDTVIIPRIEENHDDSDIEVYEIDPEFQPTPNGTPYWIPNVPQNEKPNYVDEFDSFDDVFNMYLVYSQKARFNIRKSGIKRKKGEITHRSVYCNRAGKPRIKEVNTLKECAKVDGVDVPKKKKKRRTKSKAIDCPAKISMRKIPGTEKYIVYDFVENHNHPLMNLNNMDLSRARRQLEFSDYVFIHRTSLTSIGPTVAHRIKVALVGGYDKVHGTPTDWRNFRRKVNSFIGDRDAHMLVDKMLRRQDHVPEFSFEYHTLPSNELIRMFWVDETMKCNYNAFGDVVSFDATFDTNRYGYKFVPFTGIDHHQKCVTFAAALLSDETYESFCWMLEAFLKVHKKAPPFAVTDQDGALRKAVVQMFPDSHHRLCMWHITQKLPVKVLGDLQTDSKFRKHFHKLVWNVYIGPEVFEQRWEGLINRYNLHDNKWLSDMYQIRERWVPGYFKDVPMCGLMKTTSRSESTNAFFQVYSHPGNTLVQFMLCFESAIEKQRYTQRALDNDSNSTIPVMVTDLPIEKHACDVYTPSIFKDVQLEIHQGFSACIQISYQSEGDVETCIIRHKDKIADRFIYSTVTFNTKDATVKCSCGHYNRHGFLCRHIFCVYRIYGIVKIPELYLKRRWKMNVLPAHLLDKRHRYGPCIEETERLASEVHSTIEDCIGLIRNDSDKLSEFLSTVKELKKKLEADTPSPTAELDKDSLIANLLDVTIPDKVVIQTPKSIFRSKGKRRIKSAAEIRTSKSTARSSRKRPYKQRTCSICHKKGHNKKTCDDRPKKNIDDEEQASVESDGDDADTVQVQEEDGIDEEYETYNEDESQEEDEIDEESDSDADDESDEYDESEQE